MATQHYGTSLADHLSTATGSLSVETGLQLSLDLLDELAAMHRRGLIHRDIKPSNVLVHDDRGALCDLGIAMPVVEITREWRAGTPGYIAPELEDGSEQALPPDRQSDVYSAAVTISRIIGDRAPAPIDHLVHAVAASDKREDRPADAQEFGRRLRSAIRASGIELATDGEARGARPEHTIGRRRTSLAVAICAALMVAALTGAAATWLLTRGVRQEAQVKASTQAALAALPDIGPSDIPQIRSARVAGRCAGQPLRNGTQQHRDASGRVIAITRVYYNNQGQACAKFEKAPASGLYNQKTYLALSLCNAQGQCDHDWNRYRIDAGPVKISVIDGCVTWRVSAMNTAETTWPVRDQLGTAGCPS